MLDLKWIRDNPQALDEALERRGAAAASPEVRRLDEARREHLQVLQGWQSRRNEASKEIGKAKASGDAARADAVMAEVADLKAKIQEGERQEKKNQADHGQRHEVFKGALADHVGEPHHLEHRDDGKHGRFLPPDLTQTTTESEGEECSLD